MPRSARTACQAQGCAKAGSGKYCAEHAEIRRLERQERVEALGSAHSRGYDSTHRKWRELVLHRDPLCRIARLCDGTARSTEADHIVPIRAGGARFDLANGQGCCKPCHASKTAIEDSSFANRKKRGALKSLGIGSRGTPFLRFSTPPRN